MRIQHMSPRQAGHFVGCGCASSERLLAVPQDGQNVAPSNSSAMHTGHPIAASLDKQYAQRPASGEAGAPQLGHRSVEAWVCTLLVSAAIRRSDNRGMGLLDFIKGEVIEVIEWMDDSRDTLTHRFPDADKAIKNGAQLIVRESQCVQFVYLGEFGDAFGPGRHTLVTDNIPVLTKLRSWKYGFNSPFKADVYFVNTRLFAGNKWGTTHPVMMPDETLGVARVRAFGTYDFRIVDARTFLREVAGSDHDFTVDEFIGTMRSRLVSAFSDAVAAARIPVLQIASRYREIGEALLPVINAVIKTKYGLELSTFVVENVSVPAEVEAALDKRASMAAVGDLNEYVKFQMAQGMEKGGGAAGTATELAVGLSMAQQIIQAQGALNTTEMLSPSDVAQRLAVTEQDVIAIIEAGELTAKKVGSAYRIRRAELDAYLTR
jgi:excisionase family DNA binding protein